MTFDLDHVLAEKAVPGLKGWTIAVQVRVDGHDRPYVSDVRLTAAENAMPLTTAAWRKVPIGALTDEAVAVYRSKVAPIVWDMLPSARRIRSEAWKSRGQSGHPDEIYAALAALFVSREREGSREPLVEVARAMGCAKSTANARLGVARKRRLLKRLPDGHELLTSKAEKLLSLSAEEGKS